jgi:hypothetical protein
MGTRLYCLVHMSFTSLATAIFLSVVQVHGFVPFAHELRGYNSQSFTNYCASSCGKLRVVEVRCFQLTIFLTAADDLTFSS